VTISRWQVYLVLALGLFGLGLGAGLGISQHRASAKAVAAQTQADQHEGAAQAHAVQAAVLKQQAEAQGAVVAQADIGVAAAKRRLAALQQVAQPGVGPGRPASLSEGVEQPQAAAIEADRDRYKMLYEQALDVIAADDKAVEAAKLQASIEHARGDQLQAALDESQKALALQKVAMDAAVHAERSSGVRAQIVRGLEGLALGYAAGRLTR